jgi:hypothetical protein
MNILPKGTEFGVHNSQADKPKIIFKFSGDLIPNILSVS